MDAAEIARYTETEMPRTGSLKRKLWKRLTRSTDREAVENIGVRRLHKRVKSAFTQRKPRQHQEGSTRHRWFHPFRRIWNRRHGRATYERLPSVVSSSTSPNRSAQSQILQTRRKSPPVLGTGVLRKQSLRRRSPQDALAEGTNVTTNVGNGFRQRINGPSSRTLSSRPPTSRGYRVLHKARSAPDYSPMKRRDSHDAHVLPSPSNSTNASASLSVAEHPEAENITAPLHSNDLSQIRTSTTSADRAEYDRLMKVCFKAPARRTPIPGPWRRSPQRAYVFRGPTSPYREVATNPMVSSSRSTYAAACVFATEPRSPRSGFGSGSSTKPKSPLRAIAARRKMTIRRPACFAVEKGYRRRISRVYPTLPTQKRSARINQVRILRASSTLPCDWTLREPQASSSTPTTSETLVADMSSLSLNSEAGSTVAGEDDREEISRQLSMMCEDNDDLSLATTEESDGATSDEDVWYDVSETPSFEEMSNGF